MTNKINISNYEAYLLDFMEGNLSGADISLLKEFVLLHPELEINLEDTELVTLESETISLGSKENLKKAAFSFSDEQLVAYIENKLAPKEKEKLEIASISDHLLAKELRLYKSTILQSDTSIVFENKESLKKQNKVIFFNTRVYAAAAALLLVFGLWFVLRNIDNNTSIPKNLSENTDPIKSTTIASANTITEQSSTYTINTTVENQRIPKTNLANTLKNSSATSYTVPLIVNNTPIDTIKPEKEEKIAVVKKDPVNEDIKIADNTNPPTKTNYIITQGSDDELADNTASKEKTGFWSKATKALKNLNKLGVKKVDAQENVTVNAEQTLLSLGNFKIEKNRYN